MSFNIQGFVLTYRKLKLLFSGNPEKQDKLMRSGRQAMDTGPRIHSVVTHLSQEYTMTMSPEETERARRRKISNKQNVTIATSTRISSHHFVPVNNTGVKEKQTLKFKSKILNDQANKQYQPLIVIQAQKDIPKTPSNGSDTKELLDQFSNSTVLPFPIKDIKAEDINKAAKEIIQAAQSNRSRLQRHEEPNTLVGDHNKENEKDIYDFFVKLLETTFKVYNVQTDFKSEKSQSKNRLEIEEHVAKKLNVRKNPEKLDPFNGLRTSDKYYNVTDEGIYSWNDQRIQVMQKQPIYLEPPLVNIPKRKKLCSRSFSHAPRTDILCSRYESAVPERKPQKKRLKNFRNILLDTLKEDLKMDKDDFEEPQNMHEALKIIAKNKRRCRTQIRLDKGVRFKKMGDGTETDCQFRRKRVISAITEAKKHKKNNKGLSKTKTSFEPKNSMCSKKIKAAAYLNTELDEYKADELPIKPSIQSIVVRGYDFDSNTTKQVPDLKWKESSYSNITFHCLRQADSSRYYLKTAPKRGVTYLETERNDDDVRTLHDETIKKFKPSTEIITNHLQFDTDSDADESLDIDTGSNCSSLLSVCSDSLSQLLTKENIEFLTKCSTKKMKI